MNRKQRLRGVKNPLAGFLSAFTFLLTSNHRTASSPGVGTRAEK